MNNPLKPLQLAATMSKTGWLLGAIVLLIYGFCLLRYGYNFFLYDDYSILLQTPLSWQQSPSFSDRFGLLFQQNNEHRVAYLRLITILDWKLFGSVQPIHLLMVGNSSLLLVGGILYKNLDDSPFFSRGWVFLPVLFLLFQFQSWDNTFWAMASLQNFGILGWVLLALYAAQQKRVLLALLGLLLAVFTSGNGLFLGPILIALWLVEKQYRWASIALIVWVGLVWFYFHNYQQPAGYPSLVQTITKADWGQVIVFFLAFLGSNLYHPAVPFLAPLVGLLGLFWVGYLTFIRYFRQNTVLYGALLFLLLSAGAVALNRYGFGLTGAYPSRYRISSSLFLAIIYLTLLENVPKKAKKWVWGSATIGTLALYLLSLFIYLPRIRNNQELRMADNWFFRNGYSVRGSPQTNYANEVLKKAVAAGIFIPPTPILPAQSVAFQTTKMVIDSSQVEYGIDWIERRGETVAVEGWLRFRGAGVSLDKVYVVLNGQDFYPSLFHKRFDLFGQRKSMLYQDTGFLALIPADKWPVDAENWVLFAKGSGGKKVWLLPK